MGADLLLYAIGFRNNQSSLEIRVARRRVRRLTRIPQGLQHYDWKDLDDFKRQLNDDLDVIGRFGSERDIATLSGGPGIFLVVTGGVSWGDLPDGSSEAFDRVIQSKVIRDARHAKARRKAPRRRTR